MDEDLSYAKVRLDPHSEATVRGLLDKLDDPMARALCWDGAVGTSSNIGMPRTVASECGSSRTLA